ncbi:MAG: hypothetical protein A2Z66_08690 [Chloroflexi bacterium RBG_13_66_10]|nr:MAG: hypothetical protein A2Z66_08690 [Chloroflexi bacterium RBG_13_66_10]
MHGLEQSWGAEIQFVYLDIDDPRTDPFKRQLGYIVQPHLFLLDGEGRIAAQWLGPVRAEDLEAGFLAVTAP